MLQVDLIKPNAVVAVSGGVDSMVLLDLVCTSLTSSEFVVAHFNHRTRSKEDHLADVSLISAYCEEHALHLELGERTDPSDASEAVLRAARYQFLEDVQFKYGYNSIITAHHTDDVVETAIINLARGTQWRGLASIEQSDELQRPLLRSKKVDIVKHAQQNGVSWHEDETNVNTKYMRNYIRSLLAQKNDEVSAQKLMNVCLQQYILRSKIDLLLKDLIERAKDGEYYSANSIKNLPYKIRSEVMYSILMSFQRDAVINATLIFNALHFIHTAKVGASWDVGSNTQLRMYDGGYFKVEASKQLSS